MLRSLLRNGICVFAVLQSLSVSAQEQILPRGFAPGEELLMDAYLKSRAGRAAITTPPTLPVRTAAQWEESQALLITWAGFTPILRQIVDAAQEECNVIIHCADSNAVKSDLLSNGIPLTNVKYLEVPFNSIWIRDYAANTCYLNDVDSLVLVDWIYNRPRPDDDDIPMEYANYLGIPLYQTEVSPHNLMNTGGNWMVDGMGTAFASELILDENDGSGTYSLAYPNHSETQIDDIVSDFHGINRYVKMNTLPYDDIHHIDMHMKFLDEKRILVGEFPTGISDGPQLEANLLYVMSNFNNPWGDPYELIRVPMPSSTSGAYAPSASYRTYSNFVIVNKTIIMPVYRQEFDTTGVRIIQESMPGYKVVTIDADNAGANLIGSGGVIHCITHSVGVADPLRIVHNYLDDTYDTTNPYQVDAIIQHKSGIQSGMLYYTTDTTTGFTAVPMTLTSASTDTWTGFIPPHPAGTHIFYYIKGVANSGKQQVRPMPAPEGNFEFDVLLTTGIGETAGASWKEAFPNPSHGITCLPVSFGRAGYVRVKLYDMLGKEVANIFEGNVNTGEKNFFIDGLSLTPGAYLIRLDAGDSQLTQKLMVR